MKLSTNPSGEVPGRVLHLPSNITEWRHPDVQSYFSSLPVPGTHKHEYMLFFGWSAEEWYQARDVISKKLDECATLPAPVTPRANSVADQVFDSHICREHPGLFKPYWTRTCVPRPDWAVRGLLREERTGDLCEERHRYPFHTATICFTSLVKLARNTCPRWKKRKLEHVKEEPAQQETMQLVSPASPVDSSPCGSSPGLGPETGAVENNFEACFEYQKRLYRKDDVMLYFSWVERDAEGVFLTYNTRIDYKTACNGTSSIDYQWLASMGAWPEDDSRCPFYRKNGEAFMANSSFAMAGAVHEAWRSDRNFADFDFFIAENEAQVRAIPEELILKGATEEEGQSVYISPMSLRPVGPVMGTMLGSEVRIER